MGEPTGTEQVIFVDMSVHDIDRWIGAQLLDQLAVPVDVVLFRSGRIDAVYGLLLRDGRRVVTKVHRQPIDVGAVVASRAGQHLLAESGYPSPRPIAGPIEVDGRILTVESLLESGSPGDGHDPAHRQAMAASLSEHIEILRAAHHLPPDLGRPPAWVRFEQGPWPPPHDTLFDFTPKVPGFEWLDTLAQQATDILLTDRGRHTDAAVGHCDWHAGNVRFLNGRVVAAFDWTLVRASAPFLAGLAAANHTAGGTSTENTPSPQEVTAFLADFDSAQPRTFTADEQGIAAAAATWALCYNARCGLSLMTDEPPSWSPLAAMIDHGPRYLTVRW